MNFYKEFILLTAEISLAIFVAIFGYSVWDNFDQTNYNIAKHYDETRDFEIYIEDTKEHITLLDRENEINYSNLYLHNISNEDNKTLLTIKIDKKNKLFKDNILIKINETYYDVNKLDYKENGCYYYYIIDNIKFKGYETKKYNVKLLLKTDINNNINEYLNYEFVTYA